MFIRKIKNKLIYLFTSYFIIVFSFFLLGVSTFYYINAENYRLKLKEKNVSFFKNGQLVKISKIIDGDELQVQADNEKNTVIRLLGIKSFKPGNDFLFPDFGKKCMKFMNTNALNRKARIEIGKTKTDSKKRILARLLVFNQNSGKYDRDVATQLLSRGLTIVYTKYPFSRIREYLQVENLARKNKLGIWGNKHSIDVAIALKKKWLKEQIK
ncbi:MAG: thermonuclease family protein [Deltaproteobacteria bacterium]|jgi:endonuclease YncB( thermonuclease family)|nr:thermonuclease family protein [Deltaproteobacteria bacterium]